MSALRPRVQNVRRFAAVWAVALTLVPLALAQGPAPAAAPGGGASTEPVILLTGFEPFGEAKPPNPSWEGIKNLDKIDGPVLFRHVLPLGSKMQDQVVDEARVETFVKDLLMAWNDAGQETPKNDAQPEPAPAPSAREREVKAFVEHYFKVWSDQDMDAYDDCFMTDASIQYIDQRGQLFTTPRQRFVASQREIHRRSAVRSVEVPETIEIRFEQQFARAVVYWKLTAGTRVQKGYDHFTLKRDDGRWRIVNLLFYSTSDNTGD